MDKLPSLNDDDIEQILHPNNLFTDELRPLEKNTSSGPIEDIINPSLDPQSISSTHSVNDTITDIPHEPGTHLIHRMAPVGIYQGTHQDNHAQSNFNNVNNQLLPSKLFRNPLTSQQQQQQQHESSARRPKTRPAFVNKVWSMLNDKSNTNLIQWSADGKSFIVVNREEFVHEILPKYFKHSNPSSFVRQLNMYGWHKVQDVKAGSIQNSSDDKWQFENEFFIRGREDLLEKIVRQKSSAATNARINTSGNAPSLHGSDMHLMSEVNLGDTTNISALLGELDQIKYNQMAISKDLSRINKDNEMLWKENMMARERHRTQQQALEKILRFLASMVPHMDQKMITEGILNNDHANFDDSLINSSDFHGLNMNMNMNMNNENNANGKNSGANAFGAGFMSEGLNMDQPDFLRANMPKSRYLLKNRTNSSVSEEGKLPLNANIDEGDSRISEIPFEEEEGNNDDNQDRKERDARYSASHHGNHNMAGDATVSFLNHLQSNIDEQDARIQHLEDMVQVMSPPENSAEHDKTHQNFDLQDYCFPSQTASSPLDSNELGGKLSNNIIGNTGLSPLLPSENDDLMSLQGNSPGVIIQDLASPSSPPPHGKRFIEEVTEEPSTSGNVPSIEEINKPIGSNSNQQKRLKR